MFDILFWNNDTTRLPAAFHGDLIEMFKSNPLTRPDALEVCGTAIDLKQVKCDIYSLMAPTTTSPLAVMLPLGTSVRRQDRIRTVQQRAYPEHPQPAGQPEGTFHDRCRSPG